MRLFENLNIDFKLVITVAIFTIVSISLSTKRQAKNRIN